MRTQDVVDGADRVLGTNDIGKSLVQEVHFDSEIYYFPRAAPTAQAGGYAKWSPCHLLVQFGNVGSDSSFDLSLEFGIHVGEREYGHPSATGETFLRFW